MSQHGDTAEQIASMISSATIKGIEVVSNLAGKGALSLATFLVAALKNQKRTKGKARMQAFHGKPTKVFVIKNSELKRFAEEARKYGVLYAAVVNRKQPDGLCDIVVNANDAAKVNRIAERFALSTVDVEKIRKDIKKTREEKTKESSSEKTRNTLPTEKGVYTLDENTLDEMLSPTHKKIQKQPPKQPNPTMARAEKPNLSAPSSKHKKDSASENTIDARPSVRRQIKEIKDERHTQSRKPKGSNRSKTHRNIHKHPVQAKKKTKYKRR